MDIVCLGELLVDMFPAEVGRSLVEVSAFRPKPGGAPANVAVAARRLGAQSAFIGKVGDDAFGHHLADILREEGVDVRGMRYDQEARTGMAFIAMPDVNTYEILFYRNPGADAEPLARPGQRLPDIGLTTPQQQNLHLPTTTDLPPTEACRNHPTLVEYHDISGT